MVQRRLNSEMVGVEPPDDQDLTRKLKRRGPSATTPRRRTGAGAATASGTTFQENVAAWLAVQILAEHATSPGFGLPESVTLEELTAESFQPVDDLLVRTSAGGQLFLQCKTRIALSPDPRSEFSTVVRQFVRQLLAGDQRGERQSHALAADLDRLILAVGEATPGSVTRDLAEALETVGTATTTDLLHDFQLLRDQKQQTALSILHSHFDREWASLTGRFPTTDEWLTFVQLTRVRRFSLQTDGEHRRSADALLRTQILRDPVRSGVAWAELLRTVRAFGPARIGGDRSFLREKLTAAGVGLHAARGYRDDVEALRRYSRTRLSQLARHSRIPFGTRELKIARPAVEGILTMSRDDGLLVIGEPGGGKSGCIHEFASRVFADGWGCVLLEAEYLSASSIVTLSKDLGLSENRTLVDVLSNWPTRPEADGTEAPRYLVIDALDAARGQFSLATFCDLVRQVRERAPGWRVVASIREFDLGHSDVLQELFPGQPHHTFQTSSFARVRHVYVHRLTDEELESAKQQIPELSAVLVRENASLVALIRNPFNLRLLVELISQRVSPVDLATVRVQVELLDHYWNKRVGPDPDGAIEHVVSSLIAEMRLRRELSVDRMGIVSALSGQTNVLTHLLTQGLLRSEQRLPLPGSQTLLSFSHNILFDYAVARVWLRDLPEDVIRELESGASQDLVLFARPSIILAFHRLWYLQPTTASREMFWQRAIAFTGSGLRLVGKIIAATVAASEFRALSEIEYLLDSVDSQGVTPSGSLLKHVLGAALSRSGAPAITKGILGADAPPWLEVAAAIADRGLVGFAWQIRLLILPIQTAKRARFTRGQRRSANTAARTLLRWSASDPTLRSIEPTAVSVACRTIRANPSATLMTLRPLLDQSRSEDWYQLLQPMGENLGRIATVSPRLAAQVIRAAFTREYDRDERYNLGGRLLPMAFSKKDALESTRRLLGKALTSLSARRPATATYLTLLLMRCVVAAERRYGSRRRRMMRVPFRGREATILEDYSYIWGGSEHARHEAWSPALVGLRQMLERLGQDPASQDRLESVLNLFARYGRPAIVWNVLLRAAQKAPATLGVQVSALLASRDVLVRSDTAAAASGLLAEVWEYLPVETRAAIERIILSLPEGATTSQIEWLAHCRDRLLVSIPAGAAATPEAQAALAQTDVPPPPSPNPEHSGWLLGSLSHDERLRLHGVDVDAEPNREIHQLTKILEDSKPAAGNQRLEVENAKRLLATLSTLRVRLADATEGGVHPEVSQRAESAYYEVLAILARAEDITTVHGVSETLRRLLLQASVDPRPAAPTSEDDAHDGFASWGGGQPRIEAAAGIVSLVRSLPAPEHEQQLFDALRRLARDSHWAVRFQVVAHVNALWNANRPLMWEIIEEAAREETDLRVLRFFAHTLVTTLRGTDPDKVDSLLTLAQERVSDMEDRDSIATALSSLTLWRVIVQDHQPSRARIAAWVDDPLRAMPYLQNVIHQSRGVMVLDAVAGDESKAARARQWAFELLQSVLVRLLDLYRTLQDAHRGRATEWLQTDVDALQNLYRIADNVSNQVYFASGAFDNRSSQATDDEASARTPEQIGRFFTESRSLLEQLCDCPFLNSAHHALKTLQFLIPRDPTAVFQLVHRCVLSAREDFIQNESLAADLVVEIIERYLAEYRDIFRRSIPLREALLDVLDLFVESGWLQATRLTSRLDEVFR